LTIKNNLTLTGSATLAFDLGTTSDRVNVTGNLILAGNLNITDAGGFGAGTYTILTHTGSLTNSGVTIGTTPNPFYSYQLDTSVAGQVRLLVQVTFASWQVENFGTTNDIAAATADPDGDGVANLVEYATGTDPQAGNANPILSDLSVSNGYTYLRLSLNRDTNATGVVIEGMSAGDLLDWSTVTTVIESNTPSFFRVRDAFPIETNSQRFLKLRFSMP
jgi:hypothetical protein